MVTGCAQGSFLITSGVSKAVTGRGMVRNRLRLLRYRTTPLTFVFCDSPPLLVLRGTTTKNSLTCAVIAPSCLLYRHYPLTAPLHIKALATLANPRRSLRSRMPVAPYGRECSSLATLANARRSLRSRILVARYARECSLVAGLRGTRLGAFIKHCAPTRCQLRAPIIYKGRHYRLSIMPFIVGLECSLAARRWLVGKVRRAPAPLRRASVYGGRPALRPFAAAPRPVASARRPAPRAPLRELTISALVCGVHRLCVVGRFSFEVVGSVAVLGCPRSSCALVAVAPMSHAARCPPLPAPALRLLSMLPLFATSA